MECPGCGRRFDMRDLRQVIEHVHNAEIEISEGPAPSREADAEGYFEYFVPVRNIPQCE
jgi:hypothetical protein